MYMDVKVFIFTLWAFSFTLAQNQNVEKCFRRSIAFDKTQTSDLLDSYTHDQIVKVNCELGYVGFVKLRCKNGQWEKIGGRDCKKKPCGHPGDTQNGDFELTEETEFVFGATVKYTCRPGYVMASRVSTRRCLSQGWDNAIPVCEVVKCPAISSFADVIARGNTEDANFGDVIHFECASDKKMLDNPEDIHCTEEGSWSGPVPKCIEIKCRPPEIQNGDITNYKKEYKENDHLTYRCQPHYNPRPGIPKCTKYGWSMKPDCEEILCLLDPPTLGRKETNPIGKNVFRVGDQVEIICSEGYWFKNSKQQSKTFRCKDNGKWNGTTTCEEIICERPRGQFVQSTQLFYFKKEGDTVSSYQCEYGYRAAGPTASCTRDGWKPNPLCIEIKCQLPTIQHGYVTNPKSEYKINERLTYACNTGYEPEKTRNIQCNKHDNWENVPRCKVKEGACEELSLENGFMHSLNGQHQSYSYACEPGYKLFHENWWGVVNCIDGKWTFIDFPSKKPLCIDINECGFLPSDPHVALPHTQQVYKDGYASKQVCSPGYAPKQSHIKCENGKWNIPDCIRTCGPPPYIENAVITSHTQRTATYGCRDLFEIKGNPTISCSNSKWGKEPTCELSSIACLQPKHDIFNGLLEESDNVKKYLYKKDDIVKYKCSDNFVFEEKDIATCIGKEWEYPTCMKACGGPPYTENAVITSLTQLRATYTCRDLFEMNGNAIISCKNSNWGEKPTCELSPSACSQPQKTIKQGQIKDSPRLKEYFEKNSTVTYVCDDKLLPTARCIGKAWEYPNCTGQD